MTENGKLLCGGASPHSPPMAPTRVARHIKIRAVLQEGANICDHPMRSPSQFVLNQQNASTMPSLVASLGHVSNDRGRHVRGAAVRASHIK